MYNTDVMREKTRVLWKSAQISTYNREIVFISDPVWSLIILNFLEMGVVAWERVSLSTINGFKELGAVIMGD